MARYSNDVTTSKSQEEVNIIIENYMKKEGFRRNKGKEENVWIKGFGILTGPQCIKAVYENGKVHVEGWIKFALFPGVFIGEMGVDGLFGVIPKKMLKSRLNKFESLFSM